MKLTFCCSDTRPEPWLDGLRAALPEADVSLWGPGAAAADYAVVWSPPQAFIDQQPGLKALFNIGAGVDALLHLRLPPQLPVVRLDDAGMGAQMAEYVCHAVIRYFRGFDYNAHFQTTAQWQKYPQRRRQDFAIGVMGMGVLGSCVAQALTSFGFPVNGWSRTPKGVKGVCGYHGPKDLDPFLMASQVLVNLLPLTDDTRDILNHRTLSRLRPGAYVINVARGAHLVEGDLLALLDSGHLAGATLDVFRTEPLPPEHPFWRHPRITVTPHTSARTLRDESIAQIARKIRALQRDEPIVGVVDRARGY